MQGSKAIIAVSEGVKNQLIDTFGLTSSANIRVIYNAVDERNFMWDPVMGLTERHRWGLSESDFVVVMVARLSDRQKAQSVALEAFAKLPTSPQRSVLVFVGEGPSRAILEAKTDQLVLRDRVIFTGRLPDVRNLLNMADVVILPSRFEGFPIALLEAMACRLPIVASRVTGVPEMLEDNVSGFIIEPANVEELAFKLLLLYQDEALRNRLGKAAQMTIKEKFSLRRMIKETLKVYN
jgi:glycosyltransferase involved in cell wall biosynthesis